MKNTNQYVDLSKYPYSIEDLASKFQTTVNTFRVWKSKMEKRGHLPKRASSDPAFATKLPNSTKIRYSQTYLSTILQVREVTPKRRSRTNGGTTPVKTGKGLTFNVRIPDDGVLLEFLLKTFGHRKAIEGYLTNHLMKLAEPTLSKIRDLKAKHEAELQDLIKRGA
jgi:hypothetical protein